MINDNGFHTTIPSQNPDDDAPQHSPAYASILASMNAYAMWETMDTAEKLEVILVHFTAIEWWKPEYLAILASVRHTPAGKWEQVKATFKERGGWAPDLETAVDNHLKEQATIPTSPPRKPVRPCITTMDTVERTPIDWLWYPYLAIGKICMLDGDPGIGKSLLTLQIAACLSRGWPLPDQEGKPTLPVGGTHHTLMLSVEDGLADTVKGRLDDATPEKGKLDAAGADSRKVHVLTGWLGDEDEVRAFTLQHMQVLEQAIKETNPRLVIIDPIQNVIGQVDMSRANETRPLFTKLKELAEQYRFAVICVRHPTKPGQNVSKAMYRGMGGMDFVGVARSGLFVEQHPTEKDLALLAHYKSNLSALGRTMVFSKGDGQFAWAGVSRLSAEMLAGSGRGPDPHAFLDAVLWLERRLEGGRPWNATDIQTEAQEEGIKKDTLFKAKKSLRVQSTQGIGGWTWRLPSLSLTPSTDSTTSTATTAATTPSDPVSGSHAPSDNVSHASQPTPDTAVAVVAPVVAELAGVLCFDGSVYDGPPDVEVATGGNLCPSSPQTPAGSAGGPCRTPGCPGALKQDKRAVYCPDCRGRWDL